MIETPRVIYIAPAGSLFPCDISFGRNYPDQSEGVVIEMNKWLDLTRNMDEHPEGWDTPCECKLCQSYGD